MTAARRDHEIDYQAALINIFSTYLSRNTDNVFMLFDVKSFKPDYISSNVERVLGIPKDKMEADIHNFQPTHMREELGKHIALLCALEPGAEAEDMYLQWVNPQTQERMWILESAYCTAVQGRKKLVFYLSDRTQERKAQDNLSEALRIAKAANEAKSAFLGSVSHDIRTPMNAILGFTSLLDNEADNPAMVREYAQRIDATGQHLLSLINDVLDINKIESGNATLNLVELDLAEIIDEINAIIRPQAKAKDQTFDIFVSPLKYELLQGDKLRINQVLINLLSNSVKYTPVGGSIKVTSKLGEGSTFTVELELHIQEQEDDSQFWADCGLARMLVADDEEDTCQSIARLMSQTGVEVDCAAGGESAFDMLCSAREAGRPYDVILLDWKMPHLNGLETARLIQERYPDKIPILMLTAYDWSEIEQEAKALGVQHFMPKPFFLSTFKNAIHRIMGDVNKKEERNANDDVVRGKHILVVDDIEVNRIILVKILSTLGAVCDTAGNGQEAVETFERSQPGEYDLILMDVQMPVLNGYKATKAIRGGSHPSAKTIPIIAMTANAFVDDVRDAIEAGMDAHVAKPVQIDNLKSTVREVLDSRSGQTEDPEKAGNT